MESQIALETLIKHSTLELIKARQVGADLYARGDMENFNEASRRVKEIQSLISSLEQARAQWLQVFPAAQPQNLLPPARTPQRCYRLPILQALAEMDGRAPTGRVLDRVGVLMADILNQTDREFLLHGKKIRWRTTAMWERSDMVKDGLLSSQSQKGVWEITQAGRQHLQNAAAVKQAGLLPD